MRRSLYDLMANGLTRIAILWLASAQRQPTPALVRIEAYRRRVNG